jgi:hypothetical protein
MYDCPDQACYQYRIITADVAGVLLHDQRIDQHLEGGLGFDNEVIILRGRLDESAEHHPILGRTRDRELSVCPGHCFKADAATLVPFPGTGDDLPELADPSLPAVASRACLSGKCRYSPLRRP